MTFVGRSSAFSGGKRKWGNGDDPVNFIGQGYLQAVFAAIFDLPLRSFRAEEQASLVAGADASYVSIVRACDYYESDVVRYGRSSMMKAYMIRGVSAAFMDLAYGKTYPEGLNTFKCDQTKGIEEVDEYGELLAIHA